MLAINGNVGFLSQLAVNGLIAGSIYGMVGLGFSLIYSTGRLFHFAHGAVYVAGAYGAYALLRLAGLPLLLVIPLVVAGTALMGVALELWIYQPLRRAHATPRGVLIASIGAFIAVQNIIALIFGADTKVLRNSESQIGHVLVNVRFTNIQAAIVISNLLLCLIVWCGLRFSSFGRNIRALMDDPELARIVGLSDRQLLLIVFAFGSALAGIAAILVGFDSDLTPTIGFQAILMGIISVIIGGVGSPAGAVWGGFLVGLMQHLSGAMVQAKWERSVVFILLITFLMLRPQGITGRSFGRRTI